jgi:hypothetical protein
MANVTNAFSSKYSLDNQILGQYENQNNQIKNQEIMYNANVNDRQEGADHKREVYSSNKDLVVLKLKESKDLHRLTSCLQE